MSEMLQRTPLFEEHIALGARMVPFAGYEMPVQYQGIIDEHKATRESAGIFDVSHMAAFRVRGEGSKEFLQKMLTNDLDRIDEFGAAQYTLMLDQEGHIIDDLIVYHTGFEYLIIANASNHQADFAWLLAHKPEGVELFDESSRTSLIALQGPKAIEIITDLCGQEWELPARFHISAAVLDGSIDCLIARTGYTGEDGVEIVARADDAVAIWRLLLSFPEVTPVGLGARDTLRLEMGYHLYGNDMDQTRDPISAGLGWVCPSAKQDYVGCQTVAYVREVGPEYKLVHLLVEGGIPRHGYLVMHENNEVGVVGSGSHSPTLEQGLATAYVPRELSEVGTVLQIAIRRKMVDAVVVKPPFLKK